VGESEGGRNVSPQEAMGKLPAYLARFEVDEETGCWLWTGSVSAKGYGDTGRGLAHRHIYAKIYGPVPHGFVVHHKCGTRGCVNPEHLEALSYAEHNRRRTGISLTPDLVMEIRQLRRDTGLSVRRIAMRIGVKPSTVQSVVEGRNWKDVQL